MGSINFTIHPLFFLFGFYYALTGKIFIFIIVTICAVVHELGHSIKASSIGYRLNKITLMPFGAVVDGNIEGIKPIDEIKIALAGPLVNLAVGIFFVALWWVYPESYAFTDVVVESCFSLALVNLIPAYPLDGGRVVNALLKSKLGSKKANGIMKGIGITFSVLLLIGFIATCFVAVNLSLLFFSLFMLFGSLFNRGAGKYVRLYSDISTKRLKQGMIIKRVAIDKSVTIKKLTTILDEEALNEVCVFDGDKKVATLSQKNLSDIIKRADFYSPISKYLDGAV